MNAKDLSEKVLPLVRNNNALAQTFSAALLSHDKAQIRKVFNDHAGVDLSDADIETAVNEFGNQEQIAAYT